MVGKILQKGANVALTKIARDLSEIYVGLGWSPRTIPGMEVDASAFALTAKGKVRGDCDLVFYNNPGIAEQSIQVLAESRSVGGQSDCQGFGLDLAHIPIEIQTVAFAVTVYEGTERHQCFGSLDSAWARVVSLPDGVEMVRFALPLAETPETAMIFCEIYRHQNDWKFRAVGQGYVGGLEPLARRFGIQVAEEESANEDSSDTAIAIPGAESVGRSSQAAVVSGSAGKQLEQVMEASTEQEPTRLSLDAPSPLVASQAEPGYHVSSQEQRITELSRKDTVLADLADKASCELEKHGLRDHQARFALCLDISGSMQAFYSKGSIDLLIRRFLGLDALVNGESGIDVFLFGANAYLCGTLSRENYPVFVRDLLHHHKLESGTSYGKVMQIVRKRYHDAPESENIPLYVLFVTDGDASDSKLAAQEIMDSSREAIFWQFLALGDCPAERKGFFRKLLSTNFDFLERLHQIRNRFVDNAGVCIIPDPAEPSDEDFFQLLMSAYPTWLKAARAKNVLR